MSLFLCSCCSTACCPHCSWHCPPRLYHNMVRYLENTSLLLSNQPSAFIVLRLSRGLVNILMECLLMSFYLKKSEGFNHSASGHYFWSIFYPQKIKKLKAAIPRIERIWIINQVLRGRLYPKQSLVSLLKTFSQIFDNQVRWRNTILIASAIKSGHIATQCNFNIYKLHVIL